MKFEEIEAARQKYLEKFKKAAKIGLIVAAVMLVPIVISNLTTLSRYTALGWLFIIPIGLFFSLIPFGTVLLIFFLVNHRELMEFKEKYKVYFVEEAIQKAFPGSTYSKADGLPKETLHNTGMMSIGDRYHSDDLVVGSYKGLKFSQADVHIEEETSDSDGNTSYITIFRGRYAIFDIKKDFKYRMAVVGRSFRAINLKKKDGTNKLRKREIESPDFNKQFRLYAEDGFETYYLLDPAFIARIEALGNEYNNRVALFFYKGELHIAINNFSNAFEPASVFKPLDEKAEMEKVTKDIKLITDVVDSLKIR